MVLIILLNLVYRAESLGLVPLIAVFVYAILNYFLRNSKIDGLLKQSNRHSSLIFFLSNIVSYILIYLDYGYQGYSVYGEFYSMTLVYISCSFVLLYMYLNSLPSKYSLFLYSISSLICAAIAQKDIISVFIIFELVNFIIIILFMEFYFFSKQRSDNFLFYVLVYNFFVSVIFMYYIFFVKFFYGSTDISFILSFSDNYNRFFFLFILFLKTNLTPLINLNIRVYRNISTIAILIYTCSIIFYLIFFCLYATSFGDVNSFFLVLMSFSVFFTAVKARSNYDYLFLSTQLFSLNFIFFIFF